MTAAAPVLIVDDDDSIREFIEIVLRDEGYQVVSATDGASALALLDQHHPSLILLDMRMPVMDGWEFTRTYRSGPQPHAPIVVFSAAPETSARAAEVDADDFLAKPFELDDLLSTVQKYVQRG